MSTQSWVISYVVEVFFLLWLLRWGGARVLEGTFASGCLISFLTPTWSEEQIRLFALVALLASTAWFLLGLFQPEARLL